MFSLTLGCAAQSQEPGHPSVLVVSFDTLRRDRLGAYGNVDRLTPNLDAFARSALVFDNAVAPSNETLFSHAALFTGRYVSEIGAVDYSFTLPPEEKTLAEVFGLYGYETGAFVAGGHLDPVFGLQDGFGTYESVRDWGSFFHTVPPALAWLDDVDGDFFLVVHGYDAHHRYLKPHSDLPEGVAGEVARRHSGTARVVEGQYFPDKRFGDLFAKDHLRAWDAAARAREREGGVPFGPTAAAAVAGVYDSAVQYGDAWFGELMAGLESRGKLDDTIIVVLGDHGEDLGEHGLFNHRPPLCEDVVRVPLLISVPGGRTGRVSETVSLVDIAPTLFAATGLAPPAGLSGSDLLAPPKERTVFSESAFRELLATRGAARLSFSGLSPHNPFLVPIMKASDPHGPAWEGDLSLRDELISWREKLDPRASGEVSEERRELLGQRGYWTP